MPDDAPVMMTTLSLIMMASSVAILVLPGSRADKVLNEPTPPVGFGRRQYVFRERVRS
jgi:hypothetical protein